MDLMAEHVVRFTAGVRAGELRNGRVARLFVSFEG